MVIYILIAAILCIGFILLLVIHYRRPRLTKKEIALINAEWERIRHKISEEPTHALIEADKLLDFVLKKRGYSGSLADKLRDAESFFSNPDGVWAAHKLRNKAAHEISFHISEDEARKAISQIKKALWDIGVHIV